MIQKKSATLDEIVTKFYDTANAFKKIVPDSSFISRINMLKIVNGEDALVFVQSSNTTIGVNFRTATVSELKSGRSWASVSTPERSAGVFTENLTVKA